MARTPPVDPGRRGNFNPEGYIKVWTGNPEIPYYYTREDDPGYGYLPDVFDGRDYIVTRYVIEDIEWRVGIPTGNDVAETHHNNFAREQSVSALEGKIDVIYGIDRIGPRIFDLVQGSWLVNGAVKSGLIQAHGLGHGEIDSLLKIEVGEEIVTLNPGGGDAGFSGYFGSDISYHLYLGTLNQVVDPDLKKLHEAAGHGSYPFIYPGLAYLTWRVVYPADQASRTAQFPAPLYTVKGKKLYDPRLGLAGDGTPNQLPAWSDNPALCLADYLWNPFYGLGVGLSGIDWQSVVDAANYCDETIAADSLIRIDVSQRGQFWSSTPPTISVDPPTGAGGVQATAAVSDYFFNGQFWEVRRVTITNPGKGYIVQPRVWTVPYNHPDGAQSSADTVLVPVRGQKRHTFNMAISRPASHKAIIDLIRLHFRASVIRRNGKYAIVVDKQRARVPFSLTPDNSRPVSLRRVGFSEIPNRVVVSWISPEDNYAEQQAVAETAGVQAGLEALRETTYSMDGCRNPTEALTDAYYFLNKGLLNLRAEAVATTPEAMKLEPLDRVPYTTPSLGLDSQDFSVDDILEGDERRLSLTQYSDALYETLVGTISNGVSTTLVSPNDPPPAVTDIKIDHAAQTAWWSASTRRSSKFFPTGWTAYGGITGFTAAKVNDGGLASSAFTIPSSTQAGVQLDAGVAVYIDEVEWVRQNAYATNFSVQYSDDGIAWSSPAGGPYHHREISNDGTWFRGATELPAATGPNDARGTPHRFWRFYTPATPGAGASYAEVWPRSYGDQWPYIRGYNVINPATGNIAAFFDYLPTEARPAPLPAEVITPTAGGSSIDFVVEPVSSNGIVGDRNRETSASALSAPTNLVLAEVEYPGSGGLPVRKVKITYSPVAGITGSFTRVEYKIGATGEWVVLDESNNGVAFIDDIIPATTYYVRLFTIMPGNIWSAALTGQILTTDPTQTAASKSLRISSNLQLVAYDADGVLYPNQTVIFYAQKINTTAVVNWSITRADGSEPTGGPFLSAATGDSVTLTAANFDVARGLTQGVIVIATLTDIVTFTDRLSINAIQDGIVGPPGPPGPSAVPLEIVKDRDVITYNANGDLDPAAQTTKLWIQKQNTTKNALWSIKRVDGTVLDVNYYLEPVDDSAEIAFHNNRFGTDIDNEMIANGWAGVIEWEANILPETRQLTGPKFEQARGTTRGVFISAELTDAGVTVSDTTSILSVQDGATGADATAGAFALPNTATSIGGRVLVGATTKLAQLLGSNDTTMYVQHNNLANGDIVYIQTAPGGIKQVEFIKVTSAAGGVGPYSYTIQRNLDGSGNNQWAAGDVVFSTGVTGTGFFDIYADSGMANAAQLGPTIVGNVRTGVAWNDIEARMALGNLNGLFGYAAGIMGAAFGVPSGAWIKIDPTNGVRIGHNATTKVQIDAAGNATFAGSLTLENTLPANKITGLATVATTGLYGDIGGAKPPANADVTLSAINGGLNLTGGGLVLVSGGASIRGGQTAWNTGAGFWLGDVAGVTKFSIGNASGNRLTWNGSVLAIVGNVTADGGTIGGWEIGASTIHSALDEVVLDATNRRITAGNVRISADGVRIINGPDKASAFSFEDGAGNPSGGIGYVDYVLKISNEQVWLTLQKLSSIPGTPTFAMETNVGFQAIDINATGKYFVDGTQVVGNQMSGWPNLAGGATLSDVITALNRARTVLLTHGLIDTTSPY